jgi:adenylate cyclase
LADIFLSYASEDRAQIEPLVAQIEGAGYSVWWDQELKGGTRFSRRIELELTAAEVVIVAWSPHAIDSRWVVDEAELALETGNLLPVSLDGARSPIGFRQLQTIDFSGWTGGDAPCVTALLEALNEHVQRGVRTPDQTVALPVSGEVKSDASIAVLPFVNMSSDPEQEYFSDGISEELLNLLAKIKEMTVIARTSSFAFKGSDKSVSEIGELLQVAHVLEGSVRKAGNRVRITAQLIETGKSSHLWSDTWDRTLDDIFAVQDEISAAIVGELKDHILGGDTMHAPESTRSASVGAYEHYMLGQQFLSKRTREDIETGKQHFDSALEADPDYAPAMVGLADALLLLSDGQGCYGRTPLSEALAAARPLLDRALKQDARSAEAHGILSLFYNLSQEQAKSQALAEQAIALNPNYARGYNLLTWALKMGGDPAAPVFSTERKALEHDPVSLIALSGVWQEYLIRGELKEATAMLEPMERTHPATPIAKSCKAASKFWQGHYAKALGLFLQPDIAFEGSLNIYNTLGIAGTLGYASSFEEFAPELALLFHLSHGERDAAARLVAQLEGQSSAKEDYETAVTLAEWKAREGKYAEALDLLIPFDDPDPDGWGPHFQLTSSCGGAVLSLYLRRKLGKRASAALTLEKLKYLHQVLLADPDGVHYATDFLAAVIAWHEGDPDAALTALENQSSRIKFNFDGYLADPTFEDLRGEPRYQALQEQLEAHLSAERKAAEDAGLLPIPEELMAKLKQD